MASSSDEVRAGPARPLDVPDSTPPPGRSVAPAGREPPAEVKAGADPPPADPAAPKARPVQLPEFPGFKLLFQLDEDTNEIVVRVIDPKDGSVIRTIPPEAVVGVLRQLRNGPGALLDEEA